MPRWTTTKEERFWEKVSKGDGCWEWTGGIHSNGYGAAYDGSPRKHKQAHRLSWEINVGPIPEGLFVLHHCDNPICVRVDHLYVGSKLDNARDRERRGRGRARGPMGSKNGTAKLTESDVVEIRKRCKDGEQGKYVAREFGVSAMVVSRVIRGLSWRHVPMEECPI